VLSRGVGDPQRARVRRRAIDEHDAGAALLAPQPKRVAASPKSLRSA
jgi:hypothetical protein